MKCICLAIAFFSIMNNLLNIEDHSLAAQPIKYAIAIHGGAGSAPSQFSDEANGRRHASLTHALQTGRDILKNGGTSLDAVEAVVKLLEDDPQFNAGKGAVFNAESGHELDAAIMDGRSKACGAVAGVTNVKNPISLARLVMTDTRHVLLAGAGAEKFAAQQQVTLVDPEYFDTPATLKRWEEFQQQRDKNGARELQLIDLDTGSYMGTVGCVALDSHGNLAAATSTGGLTNKQFGRIGDSPIIGAGTYADNQSCAVSCTGVGEQFIRNAVAYDISAKMKYLHVDVEQAVSDVLNKQLRPGDGGIIAVAQNGDISMQFNTAGMARAAADSNGRFEVRWHKPTN